MDSTFLDRMTWKNFFCSAKKYPLKQIPEKVLEVRKQILTSGKYKFLSDWTRLRTLRWKIWSKILTSGLAVWNGQILLLRNSFEIISRFRCCHSNILLTCVDSIGHVGSCGMLTHDGMTHLIIWCVCPFWLKSFNREGNMKNTILGLSMSCHWFSIDLILELQLTWSSMDKETCHNLLMKIFDPTRHPPWPYNMDRGEMETDQCVENDKHVVTHPNRWIRWLVYRPWVCTGRNWDIPVSYSLFPRLKKKSCCWLRETSDELDCRHSMYIWKEFVSRVHGSRNKKVPSIFWWAWLLGHHGHDFLNRWWPGTSRGLQQMTDDGAIKWWQWYHFQMLANMMMNNMRSTLAFFCTLARFAVCFVVASVG